MESSSYGSSVPRHLLQVQFYCCFLTIHTTHPFFSDQIRSGRITSYYRFAFGSPNSQAFLLHLQQLCIITLIARINCSLPMDSTIILFMLLLPSPLILLSLPNWEVEAAAAKGNPPPQITVMGMVYCDICSNNTFSRNSYFLPGVGVRIDCTFKAISPQTTEQISFSVNRTTNRNGVYKLEIPSVDGVECARDKAMESSCRASLMWSSSSSCNVPGYTTTSDEIAVKSTQSNLCIYSLNALNYRPSHTDITLCQN